MEKDTVFKQNVWTIMYGGNVSSDHSDSEEETTILPTVAEKTMMKSYGAQPPPEGYIPQVEEDVHVEERTSSDASSDDMEPKRKRKRQNRRHKDILECTGEREVKIVDKTLTKNQKRKLKKKRQKEKRKKEDQSVTFSFSATGTKDEQNNVETDNIEVLRDMDDLKNFFDAVWDVYQLQEKEKSSEKHSLFTQLNECMKSIKTENKEQMKEMNNIHKIKRLIILGDFKSVKETMAVMKSDRIPLISDDVYDFMITLFEYWMTDISDKG